MAVDVLTVPTITCRRRFVLVGLAHDRRRILHVHVTAHPTSAWTRQQLREALPWGVTPRDRRHDRDAVFDAAFRDPVDAVGMTDVRTAPRSPWQHPDIERVLGSIRREGLDHVVVLSERHLRRLLHAYLTYDHRSRTHLALGEDAPDPRPVPPADRGRVVAMPAVGALHHRDERRAA